MRVYYVMETQGRRCHVRTALGVDDRAWNRLHRRVHEWSRQLELRYGIPDEGELRPGELLAGGHQSDAACGCGCRAPQHSVGRWR